MFNLLERSKQLFNGESFSYYEAASEVHIEMDSMVKYLPTETILSELIENISINRTNISLTPMDFEILQSSGEIQIAEQVFRKL